MNEAVSAANAIQITDEQREAIQALVQFLQDPDPKHWFFTFTGSAGTGKTFCLKEVLAIVKRSKAKFAFTAPTNKAAKELRKQVGEASTIYSFLGLRMDKSGELKQIKEGKPPVDLDEFDALFVDEAGMVNGTLFRLLEAKAVPANLKVIFIGDRCQLPPVKEAISPVWAKSELGAELTKVMRHDNQILTLATELRGQIDSLTPSITVKNDNNGEEGVWKYRKHDFLQSIYNAAMSGGFADGESAKVIAWRNVKVEEYNRIIRSAIYGAAADHEPYILGDRLVAASPLMRGDDMLMTTDEECIVNSVLECKHPIEPRYKGFELKVTTEEGVTQRLLVLHPDSAEQFNNDSQMMAHEAKADPRRWKNFWEHKELFHDVKYAYAITAHRSQGSTYDNVWVDYQDILLNRNRKEAFQCLYVACTRPRKKLHLA